MKILINLFKIHWLLFDEVAKDKYKYVYSSLVYEFAKLEIIIDLMEKIYSTEINIEPLRLGLNRRYNVYLGEKK